MTKRQASNYVRLCNALATHGLTENEVSSLLRCERTLSRWAERECGDGREWHIEREDLPDGSEGRPVLVYHGPDRPYIRSPSSLTRRPIRDLERGAINRATAIAKAHGLTVYHQGDPRGCALYLLRPGDVPDGKCITGFYTRGIAVCID